MPARRRKKGKSDKKEEELQAAGRGEQVAGLRLDKFLKNVGLVPRRELAQEACRRGLVEIDGRRAKPSSLVRPGQRLMLRLGMTEREFEILSVPPRPVAKADRSACVRLILERKLSAEPEEPGGFNSQ